MSAMKTVSFEGASPLAVRLELRGDAWDVTVEDRLHEGVSVIWTAPGEGWLSQSGRLLPFVAARQGDTLYLWCRDEAGVGRTLALPLSSAARGRKGAGSAAGPGGGDILAPMPGKILKIPVSAGDCVAAGQAVVIMESMKMEMTLAAPGPGRVADVRCEPGQMVDMGAVLVRLEALLEALPEEPERNGDAR